DQGVLNNTMYKIFAMILTEKLELTNFKAKEYEFTNQDLKETKDYFRQMIEESPEAVIEVGKDGTIQFFSRGAETETGYDRKEILGKKVFETGLIAADYVEIAIQSFKQLSKGMDIKGLEVVVKNKNGEDILAEVNARPLRDGYLVTARDRTKRKRDEQKLQKAHDELEFRVKERTAQLTALNEDLQWEIIKHRQTEKTLRESELRYRMISELSSDYACRINVKGTPSIVWETKDLSVLSGYSFDEFREMDNIQRMIHPDSRDAFDNRVKAIKSGKSIENEYHVFRKDGKEMWVTEKLSPLLTEPGGRVTDIISVVNNITERKQFEEKLRSSEEMLQLVMNNIPQFIFWKDRNSVFLGCNANFAKIAGFDKPADIIGKTDYDMAWTKEEADFYVSCDRRVMETNTPEFHIIEPQHQADGKQAWLDTNKIPLHDVNGNVIGIIGTIEDITERLAADEIEKRREQQLIQADKLITLGILVSGVAHEINNPNQFITSHISPLKKACEGAIPILEAYYKEHGDFRIGGMNYTEFIKRVPTIFTNITEGSKRIKTIVEELREYVSESPSERIESFEFNNVVQSALTLLSNLVNRSTRRFSVHLGQDLPLFFGHYQRLEQVVINLVQNACQALTNQEESISISTRYEKKTNAIHLIVADEGIGVSPDHKEHITDPFFTTKRESGGTGLGLAISSKIILEHNGNIEFSSGTTKGTIVTVSLPLKNT
ncbi:PAS domain S-box protein, partial [bacterium]|nr:PAS domain S-box protein [bacterium]